MNTVVYLKYKYPDSNRLINGLFKFETNPFTKKYQFRDSNNNKAMLI